MSVQAPQSGDALANAVVWLVEAVTGTPATAVAVIAVALLGFLMLDGRIPARRGVALITGCFLLFSAAVVSSGMIGLLQSAPSKGEVLPMPQPALSPIIPPAAPYDPYAGASVPARPVDPPVFR